MRGSVRSGQALVLNFTQPCPPVAKADCSGWWADWGECEADGGLPEMLHPDATVAAVQQKLHLPELQKQKLQKGKGATRGDAKMAAVKQKRKGAK